tara:strand:+ start:701 stop:1471 length:771 start_codon:yes stop_codon:yes gene_type:complete
MGVKIVEAAIQQSEENWAKKLQKPLLDDSIPLYLPQSGHFLKSVLPNFLKLFFTKEFKSVDDMLQHTNTSSESFSRKWNIDDEEGSESVRRVFQETEGSGEIHNLILPILEKEFKLKGKKIRASRGSICILEEELHGGSTTANDQACRIVFPKRKVLFITAMLDFGEYNRPAYDIDVSKPRSIQSNFIEYCISSTIYFDKVLEPYLDLKHTLHFKLLYSINPNYSKPLLKFYTRLEKKIKEVLSEELIHQTFRMLR